MNMLFKSFGLAVLVVVALAAIKADSTEHYRYDELQRAFWDLEEYLIDQVGRGGKNSTYLEAAKKAERKFVVPNSLRRGAEIYVYLNEFETCNPKAIDYIWHVLYGRPNARPALLDFMGKSKKPKGFFDQLLASSIVRAGEKCKSFLEDWYRKSEAKVDPHTRKVLHNLMSRQTISEEKMDDFGTLFAKKTLSDPSLREKLFQMDDKQLMKFYRAYLEDNFFKPCEKFLAKVGPVMESASHFSPSSLNSKLFDEYSQEFKDDLVIFRTCDGKGVYSLKIYAENALKFVKKEKNDVV